MAISIPALNPTLSSASAPTRSTAPAHTTAPASATTHNSRPTDDEILGLVSGPSQDDSTSQRSAATDSNSNSSTADASATSATHSDPEQFHAIFDANPSLRDAWRDAESFREIFPDVRSAREIQKLFPTADDARAAGAQLADLAKLDTLFFSNRPESHAELAAAVYRLNPAAFRSLARMMQAISSDAGSANAQANRTATTATEIVTDAHSVPRIDATAPANPAADPAASAQSAFFHDTNAAAVTGVLDAIHSQVDRLLPDGTTGAARQRLVGEIYREVDAALRSNHAFGQQLRQAFRAGNWSPENRQALAGMVVARARQALPGIAKKVINEWTSGIVAQSNARVERQRTAERRVDIAGGSPGGEGRRALSPRDLDYRRLSDADILNL